MKKFLIGLPLIGALVMTIIFCPPTPTPQPTATPYEMTEPPVPTVTVSVTETLTPAPTDTNTPVPVPTPTYPPTNTITLQPSGTPTGTPGITFTITLPPKTSEPGHPDTPTPTRKIYYTWTPKAQADPTAALCQTGSCGMTLNFETIVDKNTLRVRIINEGYTIEKLNVTLGLGGTNYSETKVSASLPNSTAETVFTVPCDKSAKNVTLMISFGGFTADEYIPYLPCFCGG